MTELEKIKDEIKDLQSDIKFIKSAILRISGELNISSWEFVKLLKELE